MRRAASRAHSPSRGKRFRVAMTGGLRSAAFPRFKLTSSPRVYPLPRGRTSAVGDSPGGRKPYNEGTSTGHSGRVDHSPVARRNDHGPPPVSSPQKKGLSMTDRQAPPPTPDTEDLNPFHIAAR